MFYHFPLKFISNYDLQIHQGAVIIFKHCYIYEEQI